MGGDLNVLDGGPVPTDSSPADPRPGPVWTVDPADFPEAAADSIVRPLIEAVAARGCAHVALAGGSTLRPVYGRLAVCLDLPWRKTHIYFDDERAVLPDDPASNYRMAYETLLRHVPIPAGQIHRMKAEREDRDAAAAAYDRLLPDRLDVVLLGIGEDGHTASLFPGSTALAERHRRVLPVEGPKPPPKRLTLAPPVIAGARMTVLMATGRSKAAAVARALEGAYDPVGCPAQLARSGIWVLDREAAARLRSDRP